MTRDTTFDALVFLPHDGGAGSSIACTTASGTTAVAVEGHGYEQDRICVTNWPPGGATAFIRYSFNPGVRSTIACQAVLPGTQVLFRLDNPREATLWVSACTAEGTTTLQITRGKGL